MHISINLFAIASFAVSGALAFSNFAGSCSGIHLSGTEPNLDLVATCNRASGGTETSSLVLNGCYTNTNGQLSFQKNGNAFQSCHNCFIVSGTDMRCTCQLISGADTSDIDLNVNIGNDNGQLVC
ncbi:Cyanovirin-N [Auricularia subglabra TFB-10046 SS5]|uniref:Cyanovirin-N n=1 Tax=Auricularia subglabra (strain TFB-10046 / SS5) TaxID=717982 RepID=J0WRQ9_AURST|nr:Cyanovirin-N [Auricularia subglabra TFB-10046 SS5]